MQIKSIKNEANRKTKSRRNVVMLALFLPLLFGCSSMNSKFDCPNRPGVSCRSLDQVNDMVDRGVIGRDISFKGHSIQDKFYPFNSSAVGYNSVAKAPLRTGERVIRIWTAPYQDVQGNYHDEGVIYTVVNKSNWIAPKEIAAKQNGCSQC